MRRLTIGAAIASLALAGTAGPAAAKKSTTGPAKAPKRHQMFRADLSPVAVGPYGMIPATRGKARLDDSIKRDKLMIHVRNLQPGVTYAWHLHKAAAGVTNPCAAPAATAASVAGWTYGALTADQDGNANGKGASSSFSVETGATYYVDVHLPGGAVLVCGVLRSKPEKPRPAKPKRGKAKGHTAPTPTAGVTPATPAGGDPFVVGTPPGGSPTSIAGSTSPAPATGDENDQGDDSDDSTAGNSGRRGQGKGHPKKPGKGTSKH